MQQPASAAQEWRAHWPMVFAGMMGMSFYAMITYHFGLFLEPLQQEFGWSRGQISLGLTIFTGTAVLVGPFVGALIDRFGSRKIGVAGLALSALSVASLSFANSSLNQWYGLWVAIACTALAVKSTVWGAGVSSLFSTSRSMALAVMLSGSAIAQFCAPILANWLILNKGWREAYQWLGLGWGGIALLLVLFLFFDAHDQKKQVSSLNAAPVLMGGLTVAEALRNSQILRIAGANVLMSLVGAGVSVHLVPILSGTGLDRTHAAAIAGTAGIAGIAGKLLTGWLLDRYQGSLIPFTSFAMAAAGYALLLNRLDSVTALTVGVMILGYASGAGLQVTTYLCSRYAGLRNFGKIFATIGSMMMLGTSLGPWIAGAIFDATGSYDVLLFTAVPVMLLCALLFIGLGAYPDFTQQSEKID